MRLANRALFAFSSITVACGNSEGAAADRLSGVGTSASSIATSSPAGSASSASSAGGLSPSLSAGGGAAPLDDTPILPPGPVAEPGADASTACATVEASTQLEPLYLAFAFDVSGSMGKGDKPWHDATLKWDPVVSATRSFFEDPASAGLTASLTAFPIDADDDERCAAEGYLEPDVAMRALPTTAFGEELDRIREDDWRGGTPTLAVVQGVLASIATYRSEYPGRYALVLVTDGYPQGCEDDEIESVADAVRDAAEDVPTYVIGVKNPPLTGDDGEQAPDTVSNLTSIAEAGGTGQAFIIDTGDPAGTLADFKRAIETIRGAAIPCELEIPLPPDGRSFQRDHVTVSYRTASQRSDLAYNPDCVASDAGDASGWRYDDIDDPEHVILCGATCAAVQSNVDAAVEVGFTCTPVIQLLR